MTTVKVPGSFFGPESTIDPRFYKESTRAAAAALEGSMMPESNQKRVLQLQRARSIGILSSDRGLMEYIVPQLGTEFITVPYDAAEPLAAAMGQGSVPDVLLMDWHLGSEEDVLDVLGELHSSVPRMPIILLACSADLNSLIASTKLGVVDVVLMPFTQAQLQQAVLRTIQPVPRPGVQDDFKEVFLNENTSFVRVSERMREIESQCKLVARADIPVLILGESGTGKEVAALLIHKMSARNNRTFLKVNCAAMPADLLESELFGYEQGAFTGAIKSKQGRFEACNGGTIFLDEIGEMPAILQAKLLQVLQDGSFSRLGSHSMVKVDVRVIAATNIDIKASIAQKTFREDLYYRLNGFTLRMPPLRERTEEIPVLAEYFLRRNVARYGDGQPLTISRPLLQALMGHPWPGNIRELENTIKRYVVLGDDESIIEELSLHQKKPVMAAGYDEQVDMGNLKSMVRSLKGNAESVAIANYLESTGWNRKAAARGLQISYKALLYKIKQYNLSPSGTGPLSRTPVDSAASVNSRVRL